MKCSVFGTNSKHLRLNNRLNYVTLKIKKTGVYQAPENGENSMYIAVCDDELEQIEQITSLLEMYKTEHSVSLNWSVFRTGFSLLSAIEKGQSFDAVLLDIFMEDMNGMEVAQIIRDKNDVIKIIFLTSSPDFAIESYKVEASNYILKPLSKNELFLSIDKLIDSIDSEDEQALVVRDSNGGVSKVLYSKLTYIEAMGRTTVLYHSDGTSVQTNISFTDISNQLETRNEFIQVHRSYMVNLKFVYRITKNEIFLINGKSLPLARSHQRRTLDRFMDISFAGGN